MSWARSSPLPQEAGPIFLLTLIHCDSAKKVLSILQVPRVRLPGDMIQDSFLHRLA